MLKPMLEAAYAHRQAGRFAAWADGLAGKPIFIFRDGGLGDILCTFPAVAVLSRRRPGVRVAYVCNPSLVDVARLCPEVTDVFPTRSNDRVGRLLSLRHEVHLPRYADEFPGSRHSPAEPLSDQMARSVGVDPAGAGEPRLATPPLSEPARAWLEKEIGSAPWVAFHTGPSSPVREWPVSRWGELIALSSARLPGLKWVRVGPTTHFRAGSGMEAEIPGCLDSRRLFPGADALALISRATLFIGIDSGLLHAAHAFGTPALGLFGPTLPTHRLPRSVQTLFVQAPGLTCLGCHHRTQREHWDSGCGHGTACMRSLDPHRVLERAMTAGGLHTRLHFSSGT